MDGVKSDAYLILNSRQFFSSKKKKKLQAVPEGWITRTGKLDRQAY